MTLDDVYAVCEFLGDKMTDEQASRLMDNIRELSITDRERLLYQYGVPSKLYAELSMHNAEMGGLDRY